MILYTFILFIVTHAEVTSASVSHNDLIRFANANNILAERLYPQLIQESGNNIVFAPLSLMTGLGIMLYGSRGKTQEELYGALGYKKAGLPLQKIPSTYHYYLTHLLPQNQQRLANYSLFCSDQVLVTNRAPLNSKFQKDAQHLYMSDIQNVEFSNTKNITNVINNFAKQQTYGNINHVVNRVNADSSSLLIDTAFFKGNWETPFSSYLSSTFHSPRGPKYVPFMQAVHSYPYTENSSFQAILLPYIGGNVGLFILLPRQHSDFSNLEKTFNPKRIISILKELQPQNTLAVLPKFKVQYYRNFSKDFENDERFKSAFDGSGDFSGMTHINGLSVSGTLLKAKIEVDDSNQGPAATADFTQSNARRILLNHPFLFAVVDLRFNLIIFWGRVLNV